LIRPSAPSATVQGTLLLSPGRCLSGSVSGGELLFGPPRFGVAIGDRRKVWTRTSYLRKAKVVNQTLPTTSGGSSDL